MKIKNYNISLERVDKNHLEMLRNWRNSEFVSSKMLYTDFITEEMQQKWFETINNNQNYYFVANYNNVSVGLINVKNIIDNVGEGGIYLASSDFENTDIVARIVLCFNDYIFDDLKLDHIYSQVKATNQKAISSSIAQGCIKNEEKSTDEVVFFILKPENYRKKTLKIKEILNR
ncbi:GNAT family N-acetyltransferase [Flavobacterium myungsuense]|uniref:GNAT family N-acetyltransferase n=1 Tax=Flavobacterium myungsuense TaxID=651823 RepID=A0ABW3J128_9FLAO